MRLQTTPPIMYAFWPGKKRAAWTGMALTAPALELEDEVDITQPRLQA